MSKIIVALDYADPRDALDLVARLEPGRCRLKVGKELFTRGGPGLVEQLVKQGWDVFLDLKFHDIPNTVAGACAAAADLGVWMVNVHALGGRKMMEAAREALEKRSNRPLLIAVTILTSMGQEDIEEVGLAGTPASNVERLGNLAKSVGLDGVVCSPREIALMRRAQGNEFNLVTPGIRPSWAAQGDQHRVMGPGEAVTAGASYLVIGRPITGAIVPIDALSKIEDEIAHVAPQ
jgi:orotidine-5'-phosphate decarboxylase